HPRCGDVLGAQSGVRRDGVGRRRLCQLRDRQTVPADGIVPDGLGTFEATSVSMLRMVGIDVAVALSATLLFRGLSFWLPMLPGYWCTHRLLITPEPTCRSVISGEA